MEGLGWVLDGCEQNMFEGEKLGLIFWMEESLQSSQDVFFLCGFEDFVSWILLPRSLTVHP